MSNVIPLGGITRLYLDPNQVLENTKGKLDGLVIMGYTKEGNNYFASTYSDGGEVLWLIEQCKLNLLNVDIEID